MSARGKASAKAQAFANPMHMHQNVTELKVDHDEVMDYLQHVSVFQKFSDARMEQLIAKMTERRYENGATIMTAGTEAKTFFMIRSGEVKMHMVDTDRILTRVEGEYFGEIGLLAEDHKCAFTATAETDECEVYLLEKEDFDALLKDSVAERMEDLQSGMSDLKTQDNLAGDEVKSEVRKMLKEYDTDGNGKFSTDEVETIVTYLMQAEKTARDMKYVAAAALVALLAVCASMLVMVMLGNEISKDQQQDETGLMTVKGTDVAVQVASSEMSVSADGVMVMRTAADHGRRMLQDDPGAMALRTAPVITEHALSSRVPDRYLASLRNFMFTNPNDGTSSNVQVNSFVRVPEVGAHCGSVVILQTSLGNFTLDDEALYHSELNVWVEVAGSFDVEGRRRLLQTEEGRRRLNAATANAMFDFIDDPEEEFECTRTWMNETYTVEPKSPTRPYFYGGVTYEACFDSDEDGTQGGTARCFSTYGPTNGKKKPGVIEDERGLAALSVQYSLVTEDRTIIITRYPSHPLQMHVQIKDESDTLENASETVSFDFQVHDASPVARQYCAMDVSETPANHTFEDSFLSFLGVRDSLRHWSISDEDGGSKLVDYFDSDDASTNNRPHSIHMGRGTKDFSEFRYSEFQDELNATEIQSWLDRFFVSPSLYDTDDWSECEGWDMVKKAATGMDSFEEDVANIELYSKELQDTDIDHEFSRMMKHTSFAAYWEAVGQHRREDVKRRGDAELSSPALDLDEEITYAQPISFDDPYFWREYVSTAGWAEDTSEGEIEEAWYSIAESYGDDESEALYEWGDVVSAVSNRTGLSMDELITVLAPVTYEAKGVVVNVSGTHFAIDKLRLVPQGDTSSHFDPASMATDGVYAVFSSQCGTVYKVTADDHQDVSVGLVTAADDPDSDANEETIGPDADMTALPDGALVFLFFSYADAVDDTCDPAKPLPDMDIGRRLQWDVTNDETTLLAPVWQDAGGGWWAGDRSGGQQHRRQLKTTTRLNCGHNGEDLGITLNEMAQTLGLGKMPQWMKDALRQKTSYNSDEDSLKSQYTCNVCADTVSGQACDARGNGDPITKNIRKGGKINYDTDLVVEIEMCKDNLDVPCSFQFKADVQDLAPFASLAIPMSLNKMTATLRVQKYRNKARVTTAEADHLCKFSTETVTERKQVRQWHTVARPVSVYGHSCQMVAHRIRAWRSWRTVWRRQCRWGHRTDYQNFREARWVWRNVRTQRSVKKCSIDPCNNGYQVSVSTALIKDGSEAPDFVKNEGGGNSWQQSSTGTMKLIKEWCIAENQGYSLHDAKTAVDRVGVEVAWSIAATVQDCKSYKDGMFVAEMNGNFEGGINGKANYYYRQEHGEQTIEGIAKGKIQIQGYRAREYWERWNPIPKFDKPKCSGLKYSHGGKYVQGAQGEGYLKVKFQDIRSGTDGVDMVIEASVKASIIVAGTSLNLGTKKMGPKTFKNVIDPSEMPQALWDGWS